jgi:hypothetical protein
MALSSLAPSVKIISKRCAVPCGSRAAITMRRGITRNITSSLPNALTGFRHPPSCRFPNGSHFLICGTIEKQLEPSVLVLLTLAGRKNP